jgi:hypothetical protein
MRPVLIWRPRILLSSTLESSSEKIFIDHNKRLDSRASATDPSPSSISQQQDQSNLASHPSPHSSLGNPNTSPRLPPSSNPNHASAEESESEDLEVAAMANFPIDPAPYLIAGLTVEHGWNHSARGRVALGGEPMREHKDYTIVSIQPMPTDPDQLRPMLDMVVQFLQNTQRVRITSDHLSPLGLGLIRLASVLQRDQLVRSSPMNFGNHVVCVVNHDEGINSRFCSYTRLLGSCFLLFRLISRKIPMSML